MSKSSNCRMILPPDDVPTFGTRRGRRRFGHASTASREFMSLLVGGGSRAVALGLLLKLLPFAGLILWGFLYWPGAAGLLWKATDLWAEIPKSLQDLSSLSIR